MNRFIVTHDLGTSCDKATLFDIDSGVLRTTMSAYPLDTGEDGHAQQRAEDWYGAFCAANRELLEGIDPQSVRGVCISGQLMVCLALHGDEPLGSAMIWADRRAEQEKQRIAGVIGEQRFYELVGMRASANYSLPKWAYFMAHEPQKAADITCFLGAKDYINLKLTGVLATDYEEAAFMHAIELGQEDWSEELLQAAGVEKRLLPGLQTAGSFIGCVTEKAAKESGLPEGLPVIMGMGDGGAATLGAGAFRTGDAYTSLGTSSWVCAVTNSLTRDKTMAVSKIRYLGGYRESGTMQAGGYSLSWLKGILGKSYEAMNEAALRTPAGSEGMLFLPNLLGERAPFWDTQLRGAFVGMTGSMGAGHFCRAVHEGVGLQLRMILDRILAANPGLPVRQMRLVGGGAAGPLWRQVLADVYALPIVTTDTDIHAGAIGTAMLAAKGIGLIDDYSEIERYHHEVTTTQPIPENVRIYERMLSRFEMARECLTAVDHAIGE